MELEIIKHSDISIKDLLRVIEIKNVAWPHPIESQLKWIKENQHQDDLHVILKDNGKDLAYMDMCPVSAFVDDEKLFFMGVGNVCTKIHGLGHGGELVTLVNDYLKTNQQHGLLFCREKVMHFYAQYKWLVISSERAIIEGEECEDIYTMCFNTPSFSKMIYSDRVF